MKGADHDHTAEFPARWRKKPFAVVVTIVTSLLLFVLTGKLLSMLEVPGEGTSMRLRVSMQFTKPDALRLYYQTVSDSLFKDEHSLVAQRRGSPFYQEVEFLLEDSLAIRALRLDLGDNPQQGNVRLNSVVLRKGGRKITLFGNDCAPCLLQPNPCVRVTENGSLQLSPAEWYGYDPYLFTGDITQAYESLRQARNYFAFPFLVSALVYFPLLIYLLFFAGSITFSQAFYSFASCFFVLLLLLPLLGSWLGRSEQSDLEQKLVPEIPAIKTNAVFDPRRFEDRFNETFAFRSLLLKLSGTVKYRIFGSSSVEKAAVGKDGWLFLKGSFYRVDEDLQRKNRFSAYQLREKIAVMETRSALLRAKGISYHFGVWPDKHYVYPERMPFGLRLMLADSLSAAEQLIGECARRESPVKVIDPLPALLQAKSRCQLYEKFDSHWNQEGAFIAFVQLMASLHERHPTLRIPSYSEYKVEWVEESPGDLGKMIGLNGTEKKPVFSLLNDTSAVLRLSTEGFPARTEIYENKKARTSLTLLIYRDSFTTAMIPFLKSHFRKIVLLWDVPFSMDMVDKVKPDAVVECYATRYIH